MPRWLGITHHGDSLSPLFARARLICQYSPIILQNVLSLVLQIFLHIAAFEYNTTSDWLNRSQSEVVLNSNAANLGEKDKECS